MNWLKRLILCRLLILVVQNYITKIDETEMKISDHDKYITTKEVNKLTQKH